MGKDKKGNNSVNVQIGHAEGNIFYTANEQTIGGLHINLGDDENDADTLAQPDANSVALFRTLATKFTLEELETVCWELGIVYEDLPAKTLSGKARQLVQKADDLDVMAKLVAIVRRERPDAGINSLEGI
jgi:hypothetical protein